MSQAKWTKEAIAAEAKKYETRASFQKGSQAAYNAARRLGILDEVCAHTPIRKSWDPDAIAAEALKYETRKKFSDGDFAAYQAARRHGILDEVCAHMEKRGGSEADDGLPPEIRGKVERVRIMSREISDLLDEVCSHFERPRSA